VPTANNIERGRAKLQTIFKQPGEEPALLSTQKHTERLWLTTTSKEDSPTSVVLSFRADNTGTEVLPHNDLGLVKNDPEYDGCVEQEMICWTINQCKQGNIDT
jgi:hypothetical protein